MVFPNVYNYVWKLAFLKSSHMKYYQYAALRGEASFNNTLRIYQWYQMVVYFQVKLNESKKCTKWISCILNTWASIKSLCPALTMHWYLSCNASETTLQWLYTFIPWYKLVCRAFVFVIYVSAYIYQCTSLRGWIKGKIGIQIWCTRHTTSCTL